MIGDGELDWLSDADLDENMKELVAVLNRLPDIGTRSCCGGHADWEERGGSARPEGEFYVCFDIAAPSRDAWRSLDIIAWAIAIYEDDGPGRDQDDLRLVVWGEADWESPTYDRDGWVLSFQLEGRNGVDPSLLAASIEAARVS